MYNKGLFHSWVPKPVMLLLIVIIAAVFCSISGIYTTNITNIVGSTGSMTEYYLWANYAYAIGLGTVMPLIVRIKARFRTKELLVTSLTMCGLLYLVQSTTHQPYIIIACSYLIGVFKMMGMMEVVLPLMMLLSVGGNRGIFYSIYYSALLVITQLSGYFVAKVSFIFSWQISYMNLAIMCFGAALICIVFQHNQRFMRKVPFIYIDWISILLFNVTFMTLAYILAFGKQQAWFDSEIIRYASLLFGILLFIFVIRQQLIRRPFLPLNAFKKNNVRHGTIMLLCLGMYLATATIQNIFAVGILGYNPMTNASLNLLLIPGLITAAVVCYYWYKNEIPIRMLVFSGFSAFLMYSMGMYLAMATEFSYSMWYLPMFFKGYGMGVIFVTTWYYTLDKLDLASMLGLIGFAILWRTFIAVGMFSALYSWTQYQFQIQSLNNLAVYLDDAMLLRLGSGINLSLVQLNGVLAATKTVYGYINIAGIGVLLYVLFHHYGRIRILKTRVYINKLGNLMMSKKDKESIENQLPNNI